MYVEAASGSRRACTRPRSRRRARTGRFQRAICKKWPLQAVRVHKTPISDAAIRLPIGGSLGAYGSARGASV